MHAMLTLCKALQVFKALKYMHSAELLHRDIKVSTQRGSLDPRLLG